MDEPSDKSPDCEAGNPFKKSGSLVVVDMEEGNVRLSDVDMKINIVG